MRTAVLESNTFPEIWLSHQKRSSHRLDCVSLVLCAHQPSIFLAGSSQSVSKSVIGDTRYVHATSLQSCLILCDPMACSLPGSSVREILQARILEWVAISSSRGSARPRDQTKSPAAAALHSDSLALNHQGSPLRYKPLFLKSAVSRIDTGLCTN